MDDIFHDAFLSLSLKMCYFAFSNYIKHSDNTMKRLLLSLAICLTTIVGMAQYTQLTNIPTIYIETFNNRSITSKTTYIYATLTYVDGNTMVQYDSLQIRGRGNSTWNLAKKPYRLKFKESTKFLGKGFAKNKSWTLLANHADKSLLRNAVTFTMGDFLGQPFSPAAHFVDLVINGTYLGNYQVSDQVNVDNKRVEIFEQEEVATADSNITGGYLVEIDGFGTSEVVNFRTSKNLIVSVKSPDEDIINTAQKNYIKQYLNDFESSLFGSNFTDAANGYRAIADSATLVSWYIATELSANVDGFWSTFVYKDKDDPKLYFGPLWDYDIAYNNCNRVGDVTNRDMIDAGFGSDLTKVWVKRMIEDPWFNNAVNTAWKQKVAEGLEEYLYNYIDSMAVYLDRSQTKNYNRYSISSRVYNEIYLYSTYAEYINQLKTFIGEHMDFLTTRFAERANDVGGGDDPVVTLEPFVLQNEYYYRIYNKGTNKVLDIANQSADAGANVVIWSPEYGRDTQLWQIVPVGDYFQLINKATGMAFNDPSPTTAVGTALNVAVPDAADSRQWWKFVTVNENDNYNIINVYTEHAINNSGGGATDGNNILSYTSDDRNSVSNNRQWRITPEELIPDYVPDEVKEALTATIAEANAFLAALTDEQIGEGIFCYSDEQIAQLRQMVADAEAFESTVSDDYILTNVNLAKQLAAAQTKNLPDVKQKYVIRHKSSGYYLDIVEDRLSITTLNNANAGQQFSFEPTGNGYGVYLKSASGLYVALGTTNSWTMIGQEVITDETRATYDVSVSGECYRIYTLTGLLGTDATIDNSTVYANKHADRPDEVTRSEWVIEELVDELAGLKEELNTLLAQAETAIGAINKRWIGEAPMQLSQDNIDALAEAIAEAGVRIYTSKEDYEDMIDWLTDALNTLYELNAPDEDAEYYLRHLVGYNLSCSDGLILTQADTLDAAQRFRLIPVKGVMNTYNIYTNGMYVTVTDEENGTLALTETPRDERGHFVARQVGVTMFTLQSALGYLGAADAAVDLGEACIANAEDKGSNIRWRLVEATNPIIDDAIAPLHSIIDYAVIYDKNTETIRFESEDMAILAKVDVQIFTVGGRLLYTFKADERQSVANLPSGTYLVRWALGDISRSIKLKK